MPLISAQTAARPEGYFRREWRLAVERTLDMADDHTFLLPVVIDDTTQAAARVPEKFLSVQWLRVPGGRPTAALEALCRRLASGQPVALQPARKTPDQPAAARLQPGAREYPQFPREEPGQKVRFWVQVVGWGFQSSWKFFQRFPRWVRIVVYIWVSIALLSRGCMPSHEHSESISSADAKKLKEISENYQGSLNKADIAKLGAQMPESLLMEPATNRQRRTHYWRYHSARLLAILSLKNLLTPHSRRSTGESRYPITDVWI